MNRKKLAALISVLILTALPMTVFGQGDVIRVVPVGQPHTGMAIITESPADLHINVTTEEKTAHDVWLLFVIDEATYEGLVNITIDGTDGPDVLENEDFTGVPPEDHPSKIPLTDDKNYVDNDKEYPGCTDQTRYNVNAILSQMSQVYPTTSIRYVLVYGFDTVNSAGCDFTVTVNSKTHINVLVLAQGRINGEPGDSLNSNSPFSGSTLIVPELGTILIASASFGALAFYALRRRKP
jgi:hypothetical protein